MNMFLISVKRAQQELTMLREIWQVKMTQCVMASFSENYHVEDHKCVQCPGGTNNNSGDDASGPDTICNSILCGENQYVNDENECVDCEPGTYNVLEMMRVDLILYVILYNALKMNMFLSLSSMSRNV